MHKFEYSYYNKNPILFHMFRGYHAEDYFMHTHDFAEMAIVTEGECTHIAGGCEYQLKRGEVYVILPNVSHGLKNVVKPIHHYTFMLDLTNLILFDIDLKNISGFFPMFTPSPKNTFENRLFLDENELKTVSDLCEVMLKEYEEKKPGYELALRAMLISLICIMLRNYPESARDDADAGRKILPAIRYIEEHYNEKITLDVLSEKCFLSSRQLSRLFTKLYGESPMDYLLRCRLTTAYISLISSDEPVGKIARGCGFYDESHLSRLFFKHYGFLLKDVRKNRK